MWRIARADEDAKVVAMCLALNAEDPGQDRVPAAQVERTLATLRAEPTRGRAVVLEQDGALHGYALLISYWSNELGGEVLSLDEIYVAPARRGFGHGSELISALARGDGPWPARPVAMVLEVTPDNHRAQALYRKLGFRSGNVAMRLRLRG